jgi:hypothetical protein
MDSLKDTPKGVGCPIRTSRDQQLLALPPGFSQRATSFIASRCQGIHQMPLLRARPRPAPSAPPQRSCGRGQMSEDRCQRASEPDLRPEPACPLPLPSSTDLAAWYRCASIAPPMQGASASAYPCPDPARRMRPDPLHGFTTRFTMSKVRCRKTDVRCQMATRLPGVPSLLIGAPICMPCAHAF